MAMVQALPFGVLLRRYRLAADLTQEALAARAGLSARGISDLERGVRHAPYQDTVILLAAALHLTAQERLLFERASGRWRSPLPAPLGGPSPTLVPPLVGRVGDLALVARHLAGEEPALLLAGEPGIGKTRLLREAATQASGAGWRVLAGGCQRRGGQDPYAPFLQALEAYLGGASRRQRRADLVGCAWLVRLLPELAVTTVAPQWTLPSEQERRLMFQAVGRFLANVTGPSGVMLVLDDLQWAGPDALDLLATLLHAPSEAPLRVVAAYRDTEVSPHDPLAGLLADLARDRLVTQHTLSPLTPDESKKLFDVLLEEDTRPPTHIEGLVQRTGGVPFYIVSCAHLMHAGASDAEQAADIPWDVAQNIRQRMAALPTAAQELLGAAAIIGRQAPRALLVTATTHLGWSKRGVLEGLEAACQARLLVESGTETYQFAHDLIREGISTMLSSARRSALHEAVAEALEQSPGEPVVEQLAYHYSRAGDLEKAIVYLERAGDRARAMRAHAEEMTHYQELVERLQLVGRVVALAAASEKLGRALLATARYDAALDAFNRAIEIYHATDDVEGVGRVLTHIGRAHAQRGTAQEGLTLLQPLIPRLSEGAISAGTLATLYLAQAQLFAFSGQYTAQLAAATQAVDLATATHDDGLLAQAELSQGDALGGLHHQADALHVMERVVPLAETAGDLLTLSEALNNVAQAYENQGEFDKSMPYMDRALQVAEQLGDPVQLALVTCNRGQSAFYVGDWSQAHSYHERAVMMMSHLDRSLISVYPLGGLGLLLLSEGQREVGTSYLDELASTGQRSADLGLLRYARCALAECDLLDGYPEKVVTALTPLLDQPGREETGVIKLLPLLAWAYLQGGTISKAEALVEQSLTRATAQNMRRLQPDGLRVKALVAIQQECWHVAERLLDEGVSLCRSMCYPYGEAKTLYVYGQLHMRKGEPEHACARLEAAQSICARLGERLYAEHAERLLAELRGH